MFIHRVRIEPLTRDGVHLNVGGATVSLIAQPGTGRLSLMLLVDAPHDMKVSVAEPDAPTAPNAPEAP